ncbi:MAG: hypothetical protein AB1486_17485 [Planctomycetota bacterium]
MRRSRKLLWFLTVTTGALLVTIVPFVLQAGVSAGGTLANPQPVAPIADEPPPAVLELKRRSHRTPSGRLEGALQTAPRAQPSR